MRRPRLEFYCSTPSLGRILGVSTRKIISYIERGYLEPSVQDANGHGSKRIWNLDDVMQATVAQFLLDFGFTTERTRELVGQYRARREGVRR